MIALVIVVIFGIGVFVASRLTEERRKRLEHEEWMTQALDAAGRRAQGESGFGAAVQRRAEESASEASGPKGEPNFTMLSSSHEEAAKSEQKSEQKREPILGKGGEPIIDWEAVEGIKVSTKRFSERYRIYGLYVVLILAGVLFIPEAREWASARFSESWAWLTARSSDAAQWVSARYAEGQATGSTYAAVARAFVAGHFTVIWQSAALLVLAGLFLKFGKKAGIVGAAGCVLVTGYLGQREYVETQIRSALASVGASLADKGTMPSPSPDVPPYPVATPYLDTKTLCGRALVTSHDGWDQSAGYVADSAEAQKRGLTIESCRVALGLSSSAFSDLGEADLCGKALTAARDGWDYDGRYEPYAKAAQSRGMTVDSCRLALGIQDTVPTPAPTMISTPTPTATVVYAPTPIFTPDPQPSPTVTPEEIGIVRIDTPNSDWQLDANRRYWLQLNVGRTVFSVVSGAISITNDDGSVVLSCSNDPVVWITHALNGVAMLVSACFGQPAEFRVPEINGLTGQVPDVTPSVIPGPAPTKARRRGTTDAWSSDRGHYSRGR